MAKWIQPYKTGKDNCGYKHGMRNTSTYESWAHLIQRCNNPNNKDYKNYGGKGITICKSWLKFENFFADMGVKPEKLTIDRINNNGNYNPENCKWSTSTEQNHNKRKAINNQTGITGVQYNPKGDGFRAFIGFNGNELYLGCFKNIKDAVEARWNAETKYWR